MSTAACPQRFIADQIEPGMTDAPTADEGITEEESKKYREEWGIPFSRPGNAVDYSQVIISTITVSQIAELLAMRKAEMRIDVASFWVEPLYHRSRNRHRRRMATQV